MNAIVFYIKAPEWLKDEGKKISYLKERTRLVDLGNLKSGHFLSKADDDVNHGLSQMYGASQTQLGGTQMETQHDNGVATQHRDVGPVAAKASFDISKSVGKPAEQKPVKVLGLFSSLDDDDDDELVKHPIPRSNVRQLKPPPHASPLESFATAMTSSSPEKSASVAAAFTSGPNTAVRNTEYKDACVIDNIAPISATVTTAPNDILVPSTSDKHPISKT